MVIVAKVSILTLLLIMNVYGYNEFKLVRVPHPTKKLNHASSSICNTKQSQTNYEYKQICYDKDISYALELYKDKELYLIAADLTTPIGWIKTFNNNDCHLQNSNKKCSRIEVNFKDKIEKMKQHMKQKIHKKKHKHKSQQQDGNKVIISGSSESIKGKLQKTKDISLWTKDSSRITRLTDLLLLGLYIYGEKDNLQLKATNYISATEISATLNYLCDGAIPLRFDDNSQNSFLNQLFTYIGTEQRYVSIFLGENNQVMTIGQMSVKYSQMGYSGISWIQVQQDQKYAKLPIIEKMMIETADKDNSIKVKGQLQVVFTLSASYIAIPTQQLNSIAQKISPNMKFTINSQTLFLQCQIKKHKSTKFLQKKIIFDFGSNSLSIALNDLILQNTKHKLTLNLKQIQSKYIILGQPVFNKYYIIFDYVKNRLGFSLKNKSIEIIPFFNVISLLHFTMTIFIFGCCFIFCLHPCKKAYNMLSSKIIISTNSSERKKLRQYSPIQQNPYNDLKDQLQDAIGSSEAEGI